MTPEDLTDLLVWRNLITQWHLDQGLPDCGCDDDTDDEDFCEASRAYAEERYADRPTPELDGNPDQWNHDVWVAAWGRNAPIIVGDNDFRLPKAPEETSWLLTRLLVGGRQAMELSLVRLTKNKLVTLSRARVPAEPTTVAAKARRMLQGLAE